MAQSVEHVLGKDEVTGSIPVNSSKRYLHFAGTFFLYPANIAVSREKCYTVTRIYWKEAAK